MRGPSPSPGPNHADAELEAGREENERLLALADELEAIKVARAVSLGQPIEASDTAVELQQQELQGVELQNLSSSEDEDRHWRK